MLMMAVPYILFVLGVGLLVKGADWLVSGASDLGRRLGISELVIGLTVVAFGTSLPELIVSVLAGVTGNTDIAVGNILGSNIANILLILGVSACLYPLCVTKGTVWKEIPFSLLAVLLLGVMGNDRLIDGAQASQLSRSDGWVLLAFFVIFLYYTSSIAHIATPGESSQPDKPLLSITRSAILVPLGLVCLTAGGRWTVNGAVHMAQVLGVSQAMIGLTVVAVGTSLPELVTSVVAALKQKPDIAVGNVVGSNIFNIFLVLGLTSSIKPVPLSLQNNVDIGVVILVTLVLFVTMFTGKRHRLDRWEGWFMVIGYAGYVAYVVYRG
jgi:cation:H+ antiporter